jgi:hypothetical protein
MDLTGDVGQPSRYWSDCPVARVDKDRACFTAHSWRSDAPTLVSCAASTAPGSALLRLEIDHIDGDYHNNEEWNLRFLCPNCHTQTDTFSGRTRGKYVDEDGQLSLFCAVAPRPSDAA